MAREDLCNSLNRCEVVCENGEAAHGHCHRLLAVEQMCGVVFTAETGRMGDEEKETCFHPPMCNKGRQNVDRLHLFVR
jgi:hypothetical protein